MKTRATKGSGKSTTENIESSKSTGPKIPLGPDSASPPQLFILPEGISNEARIVTLQNPRSLDESRYLVCPERGFYEFKAFTEPKTTPRSPRHTQSKFKPSRTSSKNLAMGTTSKCSPINLSRTYSLSMPRCCGKTKPMVAS